MSSSGSFHMLQSKKFFLHLVLHSIVLDQDIHCSNDLNSSILRVSSKFHFFYSNCFTKKAPTSKPPKYIVLQRFRDLWGPFFGGIGHLIPETLSCEDKAQHGRQSVHLQPGLLPMCCSPRSTTARASCRTELFVKSLTAHEVSPKECP